MLRYKSRGLNTPALRPGDWGCRTGPCPKANPNPMRPRECDAQVGAENHLLHPSNTSPFSGTKSMILIIRFAITATKESFPSTAVHHLPTQDVPALINLPPCHGSISYYYHQIHHVPHRVCKLPYSQHQSSCSQKCITHRQHNVVPADKSLVADITHVALAFMSPAIFNQAQPPPSSASSWPLFTTVETARSQFANGTAIMVAIGGWGNTAGFEVAARTEMSRELFAKNVKAMVDDTGADGKQDILIANFEILSSDMVVLV